MAEVALDDGHAFAGRVALVTGAGRGIGRIVARAGTMRGGTTYTATKSAIEAHSVNLTAELKGTGVTVNVYRPGTVDTAMQTKIRGLVARLSGVGTGDVWSFGE